MRFAIIVLFATITVQGNVFGQQMPDPAKASDEFMAITKQFGEVKNDLLATQKEIQSTLDSFLTPLAGFSTAIGTSVSDIAQRWNDVSANPSEQNIARLDVAIAESAEKCRSAAHSVAEAQPKLRAEFMKVKAKYDTYVKAAKATQANTDMRAQSTRKEADALGQRILTIKNEMRLRGYLDSGKIPPAIEKEIFTYAVHYKELKSVSDLYSGLNTLLAKHLDRLNAYGPNIDRILSASDCIAVAANSADRQFAHVAVAVGLGIQMRIMTDAFGPIDEAGETMKNAMETFTEGPDMGQIIKSLDPPNVSGTKQFKDDLASKGVLEFLKNFPDGAQKQPEKAGNS